MERIAFKSGSLLIVSLDHGPWSVGQVGVPEHGFLGPGVLVPFVERGQVDRAELPRLDRVGVPVDEPAQLLGPGDREPELDQRDAVGDQAAARSSGTSARNRSYSSGWQKPITCSTPARLYQDRSNITISPGSGRWGRYLRR